MRPGTRSADVPSQRVGRLPNRRGLESYSPPDARGRYPWRLRWLGVPLFAIAAIFCGLWAWSSTEASLAEAVETHLACEGIATDGLHFDWQYRDVTISGDLPASIDPVALERVISEGSNDIACLDDHDASFSALDRIASITIDATSAP